MGLSGMETICQHLKDHGLAADTPVALVEKGTTDNQRVFIGDLDTLPAIVRESGAKAPTLIIVGHVVSLHNKLNWFNIKD
jgi:uroporphyrin-III C-methyltransferase/precorrin-2 dehydrogenase/sirohydrochlorin ferrochelatase